MLNEKLKNQRILIFGGSGSWGQELISQLLKFDVKEIISYARNEYNQVTLKRQFPDKRLKIMLGDVRDYGQVDFACKNIDIVFLLSAIKHVPLAEEFIYECIKTNINGTRNVIRASIYNKVKKVIDVSSDKACSPINLYGMTKAIGEKLTLNGVNLNNETQFTVIRSGNALGSRGSVVTLWIDQIKNYNKITITDKRMTRFFLTLPDAITLLLTALDSDMNGVLFVTKMPACKMADLAKVLIEHYGNENTIIEEVGIRPGEKLDEVLINEHESPICYEYNENYYFLSNKKINYKKVDFLKFDSKTYLMNKDDIKKLLNKGGFLV